MSKYDVETKFDKLAPLIVTAPVPPDGDIDIFVPAIIFVTALPPLPVMKLLFNKSVPELTESKFWAPVYVSSKFTLEV